VGGFISDELTSERLGFKVRNSQAGNRWGEMKLSNKTTTTKL